MSILRRTIFMERDDRFPSDGSYHRPCDWALVTTTLGAMAEPFSPFERLCPGTAVQNYNATDDMRRIDEIKFIDLDKHMKFLSGGGAQIHGGLLMPRTGR